MVGSKYIIPAICVLLRGGEGAREGERGRGREGGRGSTMCIQVGICSINLGLHSDL